MRDEPSRSGRALGVSGAHAINGRHHAGIPAKAWANALAAVFSSPGERVEGLASPGIVRRAVAILPASRRLECAGLIMGAGQELGT